MNDPRFEHAAQVLRAGSRSFGAASRLFSPDVRRSVLMLYAWCRHCDDVVDGQTLGFGMAPPSPQEAQAKLDALREETLRAYGDRPMEEPAFAAFQYVAHRHGIPRAYALEHLNGYAMDVLGHRYQSLDDTLLYCYRVAGVVGLMMASVMGIKAGPALDRACDLGIAFQLTNIARDVVEDAQGGRCYLPVSWLEAAGIPAQEVAAAEHRAALARVVARLLAEAECYYRSAHAGLAALPWRSAWAIATAHGVYREIGVKVARSGATAWDRRISTTRWEKSRLAVWGACQVLRSRWRRHEPRPATLWRRPAD